ncbi:histidine kinase [Chryseobacterium formosense]|uniref:Histidine kinase n=1 Tax=Chryseobacterium formosense TaxID=236814 RepID=A0A085Z9B8_9FLAO|nr:DUF72 domain-containing protein [Chryseobacterium formosense]KFF01032.1 histidine kinase [Chryseobacterium formosense]SFT41099.1 Uncharacterized conserved protein YecE, DUF72 family [Chryseobacterium formosense]
MKKENIYIGCSGFYNNDWKGSLYPEDAKSKDFLTLYSKEFNAVEINSTFYRKPTAKTLLKWFEETPEDFRFFIKIPKAISHEKRLKDCKEEIQEFCEHIQTHLKEKLSGFLYQFPPSFKNTEENLNLIIQNLDFDYLNVIEFRNDSWWNDEIYSILRSKKIIFSGVSFPGNLPDDFIINHAELFYYRLHGKPVLYKSEYPENEIKILAENIVKSKRKGFVFFNNTWGTAAVKNAIELNKILQK